MVLPPGAGFRESFDCLPDGMKKIASPVELQSELENILTLAESPKPSRQMLATRLTDLADRMTGRPKRALSAPHPLVNAVVLMKDVGKSFTEDQLAEGPARFSAVLDEMAKVIKLWGGNPASVKLLQRELAGLPNSRFLSRNNVNPGETETENDWFRNARRSEK